MKKDKAFIIGLLGICGFILYILLFFFEELLPGRTAVLIDCDSFIDKPGFEGVNPCFKSFLNQYPLFEVWIFFNALQMASWFCLTPVALVQITTIVQESSVSKLLFFKYYGALLIAVALLLGSITLITKNYFINFGLEDVAKEFYETPFANQALKIKVASLLGLLAQLFNITCISLVTRILTTSNVEQTRDILLFKKLRGMLLTFLAFVAIEMTLTFIATSTMSFAVNDYKGHTVYPIEHVINLGLVMTFVLATFFIPAYMKFNNIGKILALNTIKSDPASSASQGKTEHLSFNFKETLEIGLAIVSPLVGTLIPRFFEFLSRE